MDADRAQEILARLTRVRRELARLVALEIQVRADCERALAQLDAADLADVLECEGYTDVAEVSSAPAVVS